jgi:hypothetical protein
VDLVVRERRVHPVDLAGVEEPLEVRVETEARGSADRFVAARAFKDGAPVVDDVRADVDLGVRPVDQRTVHPDFSGAEGHS